MYVVTRPTHPSTYLSTHLFVLPPTHSSIYLSSHLLNLPVLLTYLLSLYLSTDLPTHLLPFIRSPTYLHIYSSTYHLLTYLPICLPVYLPIHSPPYLLT